MNTKYSDNTKGFETEWPIVGHMWAVRQMQLAVARDEVPHALLFAGPESVGKMTLARTVAAALLCKGTERPCGECLACRKLASGNHPDFLLVEPEGQRSIKIDQIRALERFLTLTPNESNHKVALIDTFESATTGAANALLKTLEEPPAYAHLILLTQDADLLLPTIVSRSQLIALRPLPCTVVEQALIERWHVEPAIAARLARISGGRIGWAVRAVTDPEYHQRMNQALTLLLDILRQDLPSRFETARVLTQGAGQLEEQLAYWLTGWRDVLLLQTENSEQLVYQEQHEAWEAIVHCVDLRTTINVIRELELSQQALKRNANPQLLTENLLLSLPTI